MGILNIRASCGNTFTTDIPLFRTTVYCMQTRTGFPYSGIKLQLTAQTGVSTMFPGTYVPRTYVPRYICCPVPMLPGTDVPRTYVPRYLCSPVPMFPEPMFPGRPYLCSPIYCKCVVGPMHVGLVIGIGIVGPQNVKT